jgi:hypothetical protein
MAIDFPASPTLNDVFTVGNVTYVWDGTKWTASVTGGISLDKIEEGNTSAEVIDTGSDGRFVVTTEGTERLRVTNTGLVGIGTNSPGSYNAYADDLVIANGSGNPGITLAGSATGWGSIYFADGTTGSEPYRGYIQYSHTNDRMTFATGGGLAAMHIDSSQRVGIGTSSPGSPLEVQASSNGGNIANDGIRVYAANRSQYANFGYNGLNATNTLEFGIADSVKMKLDSSGRLGIGTTSPTTPLSVRAVSNIPTYGNVSANFSDNTTGTLYISHSSGVQGLISDGTLAFGSGASGTERARIDTSGRLLVGTSSAVGTYGFQIEQASGSPPFAGSILLRRGLTTAEINATGYTLGAISAGSQTDIGGSILFESDAAWGSGDYPTRLVFSTTADGASSPTERMRIASNGIIVARNSVGDTLNLYNAASAGTSNAFIYGAHSSASAYTGTTSFVVWTNGNVVNTNGSYTTISDAKLKENIVSAGSQWNDIKAIQIRNWNFKAETGNETHRQIGPIAQEVEAVCPGLVFEIPDRDQDGNETGEVTKGINQSVLYMKAVKALQEAIAKIETLEGMVAVNNITIDEQQHQLSTLAARLTALESA